MLKFVGIDRADLQILGEWFQNEEVLNRLDGTLPLECLFAFVKKNPLYFVWMVYEGDTPVGNIGAEIYRDRSASITLLTNPNLRNRGYGKRMLELLLARPEVSKVNIFRVGIDADNLASIRCFQHVGFIEEGIDEDGFLSLTYKMNNHWR